MANCIEISRDGGATWKKASTRTAGETIDGEPITPALVDEDLSGNVVGSVGVDKTRWHYTLRVLTTPVDSAYASADWIKEMFRTPGKVRIKSLAGEIGEAEIVNRSAVNMRCITLDHGAGAVWLFDLDLLGKVI